MTVDLLNHEEELTRADRKILEFIGSNTEEFLFMGIGQLARRLEQNLEELEKIICPQNRGKIKFYLAPDLDMKNLAEFRRKHPSWEITDCPTAQNADLAVLTAAPNWDCEYTTLSTGGNISQKLWILCRMDKREAVALYDFIVQQLLF